MKFKMKSLLAAAALVVSGAASADGGSLSLLGASGTTLSASGTDVWTLVLGAPAVGAVGVSSAFTPTLTSVTFTTDLGAAIPDLVTLEYYPFGALFSFAELAAGTYKLSVSGAAGSIYVAATAMAPISAVTPVPEAGSIAMALAGLGVAGLWMRRRT